MKNYEWGISPTRYYYKFTKNQIVWFMEIQIELCHGQYSVILQCSCLENPMDRGTWQAKVHGIAESDMTEQLTRSLS